ncbi:GIY-YIG nuclease family protein [Streptomyces longwoodensis]|uniref:GIY-YIG nuclease family protein n=1 Tax=Streptomyces longwoodensis TaxID=68231 RepID=UPI0022501767|nr:GIY-YIG nuclease family protein [Streptomyces longwoodensis]MCX5000762.1 GIY-YIG nuclease family protein [Streptomyces longwoodensis]
MNITVFTTDLHIAGHDLPGISVTLTSSRRPPRPPFRRLDIEINTVIELLALVEGGAISAGAVRDMLESVVDEVEEADEEDRREDEALRQLRSTSAPKAPARTPQYDTRSVYVVSSEAEAKIVKIGVSKNVPGRLRSLQSGSGSPLAVRWTSTGGGLLESRLHDRFATRALGGEWFDFTDVADPVAMIARAARGLLKNATIVEFPT